MNPLQIKMAVRAVVFGLPYGLLMGLGFAWLYERRLLLHFVCGAVLISVVGWLLLWWARRRPAATGPTPPPVDNWSEAGNKAWTEVDRLAAQTETSPPPWNDANAWLRLFQHVFDVVAVQFHPQSKQSTFEVTVVETLRVAELVARDVRRFVEEHVPGSDWLTIHNLQRAKQWGPVVSTATTATYNVYRLARVVLNPAAALAREAQAALVGGGVSELLDDLPRLAAGYCVRQTGKYAIGLYSGQVVLETPELEALTADQPLRIVVLGQAKAGKSSLVNALFGDLRAAVDVLPCTDEITPYVLQRQGLPRAIIFDTIGLAGPGDPTARAKLDSELDKSDLIVVVCPANQAARAVEQQLLNGARVRFAERTRRAAPPMVVALTHIDRLRPVGEWTPPYDFVQGESSKERNVRAAVETVASELQFPRELVAPVCLRQGGVYNVEEGLLPLIAQVLPDSERAKLLRILRETRSAEQWETVKRQLFQAGLNVARIGRHLATHAIDPCRPPRS